MAGLIWCPNCGNDIYEENEINDNVYQCPKCYNLCIINENDIEKFENGHEVEGEEI